MNYRFSKTDAGVASDKKVQLAVAKLETLEARGTLIIEAGYNGTHDAYCKLSGTGLKAPINTSGKKVGDAVFDAVKKASTILRNDKKTVVDKKEHARNKANKKASEEVEDVIEF